MLQKPGFATSAVCCWEAYANTTYTVQPSKTEVQNCWKPCPIARARKQCKWHHGQAPALRGSASKQAQGMHTDVKCRVRMLPMHVNDWSMEHNPPLAEGQQTTAKQVTHRQAATTAAAPRAPTPIQHCDTLAAAATAACHVSSIIVSYPHPAGCFTHTSCVQQTAQSLHTQP